MDPDTTHTSQELAALTGGRLTGARDVDVTGVASLDEAGPTQASFLGNERYRSQVVQSRAGLVFVPEDFDEAPPPGRAWIVCKDPSAAFSQAVMLFAPPPPDFPPGRHASAAVHETATVPASVHVGACAVIERDAVVGENTVIGAGCYVGQETRIGDSCLIYPNVTIRERCLLGARVVIHSGTVIGSDGFGFIPGPTGHVKIPQVGIVQIDDDVEIGAQVGVDRARFGKTWIKRGVKIDNLVQIAHNVVIGEHCFIVAQVGVSGSVTIGNGVILAGQVGVAGHITVGDGAILMAQSGVAKDVPPGARLIGSPAVDRREFVKGHTAVKRVGRLHEAVKSLQQEVAELRARLDEDS